MWTFIYLNQDAATLVHCILLQSTIATYDRPSYYVSDPHTMNLPIIERIYPKASELSEILNYNPCPECAEVFHNTPNLEMHLAKCHGRETSRISTPHNVIKQYYCPEAGCKYSGQMIKEFGTKFFKQHKYLKQVIIVLSFTYVISFAYLEAPQLKVTLAKYRTQSIVRIK